MNDAGVSRLHMEIAFTKKDGITIRDLESLNGTFVNGRRVTDIALTQGDVIRVGTQLAILCYEPNEVDPCSFEQIAQGLWAGPTLREALRPSRAAAKSDLPILLQGATGTGKERAARAIHEWSGRVGSFVAINCAAIPEHLAEAELFGYRKGAFTGAESHSLGHLRSAHRGSLLLDEVADLPLQVQAKLLRVIEQNELQPLGETRPVPIDIRVLAASQLPLSEQVSKAKFRADLYARLNGLTVSLPLLTQRRAEIPRLFDQLIRSRLGSQSPTVEVQLIERLMVYDWPGNVRELDLVVRRLLGIYGHQPKLRLEHLEGTALSLSRDEGQHEALEVVEVNREGSSQSRNERDLQILLRGLRDCGGNLTRASNLAGISRQRAYRLLQAQGNFNLDTLRRDSFDESSE